MNNSFMTRLFLILSIAAAVFTAETAMAARLWVSPSDVTIKYTEGTNSTGTTTINVMDYDMEDTEFSWNVSCSVDWLIISSDQNSATGPGSFTVSADSSKLSSMSPGVYQATVSVNSSIGTGLVNISLDNRLPVTSEKWLCTSEWLDLHLSIPNSYIGNDDMYVLMEHPRLLPGRIYAYRCSPNSINGAESQCRLDLFSEWGHLVPGAEEMFYDSDRMLEETSGTVDVPFGGFRLIGLEGDIIITAITGLPEPGMQWGKRQLVRQVLHITPVTGTWVVTEMDHGISTTYADPDNPMQTYPMTLFESHGDILGDWLDPNGLHTLAVTYANPDDRICDEVQIIGSRLEMSNCQEPGLYNVYMETPTLFGTFEYLYNITNIFSEGSYLAGLWQYRALGDTQWSIPQPFTALKQYAYLWQYSADLMPGKRGEIEIGLHWTNVNDLDLIVTDPSGEVVYYGHPTSSSGGQLDVDSNAGCSGNLTNDAWEHVVWVNSPPKGEYKVEVNFYQHCDLAPLESSYSVVIKTGQSIQEFTGTVDEANTDHVTNAKYITTFTY